MHEMTCRREPCAIPVLGASTRTFHPGGRVTEVPATGTAAARRFQHSAAPTKRAGTMHETLPAGISRYRLTADHSISVGAAWEGAQTTPPDTTIQRISRTDITNTGSRAYKIPSWSQYERKTEAACPA